MNTSSVERIPSEIFPNASQASSYVADEIATLIRTRQAENQQCVLGLATGSTPTGIYAELVRMHRESGLSFANVITFNLDEYFPMQPKELQSYVRFMNEHLFDHIYELDRVSYLVIGTVCIGWANSLVEVRQQPSYTTVS